MFGATGGWLVDALWQINPCRLFNAKSCLYIHKMIYECLVYRLPY